MSEQQPARGRLFLRSLLGAGGGVLAGWPVGRAADGLVGNGRGLWARLGACFGACLGGLTGGWGGWGQAATALGLMLCVGGEAGLASRLTVYLTDWDGSSWAGLVPALTAGMGGRSWGWPGSSAPSAGGVGGRPARGERAAPGR